MLLFTTGDLLKDGSDVIVNPVNCVGVMGKGVALQIRNMYPHVYRSYVAKCQAKLMQPGVVEFVQFQSNNIADEDRYIANFPTKVDWRNPSELAYIANGIDDLLEKAGDLDIYSIAMPALGCGNGGLNWEDVKKIIVDKCAHISIPLKITVYEPQNWDDAVIVE